MGMSLIIFNKFNPVNPCREQLRGHTIETHLREITFPNSFKRIYR